MMDETDAHVLKNPADARGSVFCVVFLDKPGLKSLTKHPAGATTHVARRPIVSGPRYSSPEAAMCTPVVRIRGENLVRWVVFVDPLDNDLQHTSRPSVDVVLGGSPLCPPFSTAVELGAQARCLWCRSHDRWGWLGRTAHAFATSNRGDMWNPIVADR